MSDTDIKRFNYVAQDTTGSQSKGFVRAANEAKAYSIVRGRGLMPLSVKEANTGLNMQISIPGLKKKPKLKYIAVWAKQFGVLIASGMDLIKALYVSTENTEDEALKETLRKVYSDVDKGSSLTDALQKQNHVFSPLVVNLVKVGEGGGFLDDALKSISNNLNSELEIRNRIKSALIYPAVVVVIAIIAVAIMMIFVIPTFAEIFENMGSELPFITQLLINVSENALWIIPVFLVFAVSLFVAYQKNKHKEGFRSRVDPIKLKIPVAGSLLKKIALARFSRNLSMMDSAGVNIMDALDLVKGTANNWSVEQAIEHAREKMKNGSTMAAPLADNPHVFPLMVTSMIAVGEESGNLGSMLDSIADFYDDSVKTAADSLSAALEPVMLVFIGALVGGLLIAMYYPMFSLYGEIANS